MPLRLPFTEADFAAAVDRLGEEASQHLLAFFSRFPAIPMLHEGVIYSLGLDTTDPKVRGKRMRPALCMLVAEALGSPRAAALPFAAAMEVLHNFALVHDDIQDGDAMRRGRDATWVRYGTPQAINIGDYMLGKVFQMIRTDPATPDAVRIPLLGLLDDTLEELFGGQALDMHARSNRRFTPEEYKLVVDKKTGSYLAAPLLGGAVVAGAPPEVLRHLTALGHHLGPLFQIKDDLIDLTTGKGRGEIGNDIREGKRSFLVALATARCTAADVAELYAILDRNRAETSDAQVAWCIDLFRREGVLDEAENYCSQLRENARVTLAALDDPLRAVLTTAVDALASRKT